MQEEFYWLALQSIPGVGKSLYRRVVEKLGSPRAVFLADEEELLQVKGLRPGIAREILEFDRDEEVLAALKRIKRLDIRLITIGQREYPANLARIADPPVLLYVHGHIEPRDNLAVAVVGARRPTPYGRQVARQLARELAERGVCIVSGMARGIDSIAHEGALEAGGRTLAVLGSGIDVVYPPEHRELYHRIAENGAVISEFPMGTKPTGWNFPIRNRIISGLSLGTMVAEARAHSGSLITAKEAIEQGRRVFAVPGQIGSENSYGTNRLIKEGAVLVNSVDDVLRALPELGDAGDLARVLPRPPAACEKRTEELQPDENVLFSLLGEEPTHIDYIIKNSNLSYGRVSAGLINLELGGLIRSLPGKMYVRD